MRAIRYPDAESIDEITARYLLSMPVEFMPAIHGFRYDGYSIRSAVLPVDLTGGSGAPGTHPIYLRARQLRAALGPGMFGFGLSFITSADQLDGREDVRDVPAQIRTAAAQLPGADDLICAVTIDAIGRQWWAVQSRHLPELDPARIHVPAPPSGEWPMPEGFVSWLWTAVLALLDESDRPMLRDLLKGPAHG